MCSFHPSPTTALLASSLIFNKTAKEPRSLSEADGSQLRAWPPAGRGTEPLAPVPPSHCCCHCSPFPLALVSQGEPCAPSWAMRFQEAWPLPTGSQRHGASPSPSGRGTDGQTQPTLPSWLSVKSLQSVKGWAQYPAESRPLSPSRGPAALGLAEGAGSEPVLGAADRELTAPPQTQAPSSRVCGFSRECRLVAGRQLPLTMARGWMALHREGSGL